MYPDDMDGHTDALVQTRLPARAAAVAEARNALQPLERWVDPERLDDLRLVVSELVTNGIRHGSHDSEAQIGLRVRVSRKIRVEVEDPGPGFVPERPPHHRGSQGWGLVLVDRLADRWGVAPGPHATVWAELARSEPDGTSERRDEEAEGTRGPGERQMGREQLGTHNVLAVFERRETAREAVVAVERAGFDAADISLLGPETGERTERDTREEDRTIPGEVGTRAAKGAAAGTAAGGLAGFLAGAAAFAIPGVGPVFGTGVWAATVAGAVGGGAVGGVAAGVSGLGMGEAWELTHSSLKEGHIVLMVHADDRERADTALDVLRDHDPRAVERIDAEGGRVEG